MLELKELSPSAQPGRCPYLGLLDDPDTALGYPSPWNYCHKAKPVAVPSLDHQPFFCLTDQYPKCSVFPVEKKRPLPKHVQIENTRPVRAIIERWLKIVAFLIVVVFIGLALINFFLFFDELNNIFSAAPSNVLEVETATHDNLVPLQPTELETLAIRTPVGFSEESPITKVTDSLNPCAYELEALIGAERQFVVHRIVAGESLPMLARKYDTSDEAIDAVNSFLPSPLWAELVIVIPVKTTDVSGVPTLKPTFIEEKDLPLDELAGKLSVSVDDLSTLNQVDMSCRDFSGWLLVPTEKVEP